MSYPTVSLLQLQGLGHLLDTLARIGYGLAHVMLNHVDEVALRVYKYAHVDKELVQFLRPRVR